MYPPRLQTLPRARLICTCLSSMLFTSVVACALGVPASQAATVTVTCSGATTDACAASDIQSAMDVASAGSIIDIPGGTYKGGITIKRNDTLQAVPTSTTNPDGTVTVTPVTLDGQQSVTPVTVNQGVVATISGPGLTITDGAGTTRADGTTTGGGIDNYGNLTLQNHVLVGGDPCVVPPVTTINTAPEGGGIYNHNGGTLKVSGSTIECNTSTTGGGGGIANHGTLTLTRAEVESNGAAGNGGGLENFSGSGATASASAFSGNSASALGGAIYNATKLSLSLSVVEDNVATHGGGIYNSPPGSVTSTLNIFESNVPDNCEGVRC